jgi:hypothetical protein
MLYDFAREVQAMLSAQHYPVRVSFGYEPARRGAYRGHHIVLEHDDSGDTVGPALGAKRNPRMVRSRYLGCKAEIYVRSSLPAAHRGDHERECEKVVDALIAAFYKLGGRGVITVKGGKYEPGKDAPDGTQEKWPGVCYVLRFSLPRGVYDREYVAEQNPGAAAPTGAPTGVQNQTRARLTGGDPDADPDVGCGGS